MERGRPTTYTQQLADEICTRLREGRTLRAVCRDEDMPHEATVRTWAARDESGFYTQYMQAREIGYMAMADETLEISDDGTNDWMKDNEGYKVNGEHVARSRLRVDTRKWLLSKALPKIFGDKLTQSVQNLDANGNPADPPKLNVAIEFLGDAAAPRADVNATVAGRPRNVGSVDLVG